MVNNQAAAGEPPGLKRCLATIAEANVSAVRSATGMSLAADGPAVWVAGGTLGDVRLVQAGRVARRIRIGAGSVDGVARTHAALWVVFAALGPGNHYRVIRIDPEPVVRPARSSSAPPSRPPSCRPARICGSSPSTDRRR
jgi:hypothetical protein